MTTKTASGSSTLVYKCNAPYPATNKGLTVNLYKDKRGKWRWNIKATNGNILADSGQGYSRKQDCLRGLYRIIDGPITVAND